MCQCYEIPNNFRPPKKTDRNVKISGMARNIHETRRIVRISDVSKESVETYQKNLKARKERNRKTLAYAGKNHSI